jgi:hypothetical protein
MGELLRFTFVAKRSAAGFVQTQAGYILKNGQLVINLRTVDGVQIPCKTILPLSCKSRTEVESQNGPSSSRISAYSTPDTLEPSAIKLNV